MKLRSIRLQNFECFKDSREIPIYNMTIIIGENDSGKSSLLRAIEYFLNNKLIDTSMFHEINEERENLCTFEFVFEIRDGQAQNIPREWIVGSKTTLSKEFRLDNANMVSSETKIQRYLFDRASLNDIPAIKADELKKIFKEFNLEYTTVDEAKVKLVEYVQTNFDDLPKNLGFCPIRWSEVANHLPLYESYNSSAYGNPLGLVQNTLASIYRSFFYESDEEGNENLKTELKTKKEEIKAELNKKIERELKRKVKSIINKVKSISGDFTIDFSSGFQLSNILLNYGAGNRPINSVGEGSKKRLFLAITEWDREVRSKEPHRPVVRGYDEPDASLHYSAQKEIFYTLQKLAEDKKAQAQVVICTHSLSMVDRAPARIINHIVHKDGISEVDYLEGLEEADIKEFLDSISEISGIKNSSLFFERCFLIVEGHTEQNALPSIYQKKKGKTLTEDGVVLINLRSNACWDSFLKLLNKNKSDATVLFLDKDTQSDSSKRVTPDKLRQIGFSDNFMKENVIFVGSKEFEDAFPNDVICRCLNSYWPKMIAETWTLEEIETIRASDKFSDALKGMVESYRANNNVTYEHFRKPEYGKRVAETINEDEIDSITEISDLLDKLDEIVR